MKLVRLSWIPALALCLGCQDTDNSAAEKIEPAHVDHHVEEQDLNTLTLTEQAVERLDIQLAEVRVSNLPKKRTLSGEVVVPPGRAIIVSAPLAGTLLPPLDGQIALPGSKVAESQAIFRFKPLLTPERDVLMPADRVRVAQSRADIATAQLAAERDVESRRIEVGTAQIVYDSAKQLLDNNAGSQRAVDIADAQVRLADEALKTAEARHKFLSEIDLEEEAGELEIRTIMSPIDGVLQSIDAARGETVAAGEPLFQVQKTDKVWIRVPVYVGNWRNVDVTADVIVAEFGHRPGDAVRTASTCLAPPSADPNATTVDLYYDLANDDGQLYPGQKLAVTLTMRSQETNLAVPFSAVLYDIHGGAWVYAELAPHTYARQRVAVSYVDGETAILARGPEVGTKVVTDGAAELFGTEFGVGH